MSIKNKGNQKSNQSKQWMENALLKLMQTKNYTEITIQDITNSAQLSRRTFYRNYDSKDAILESHFYKIWLEYQSLVRNQTDFSLPSITKVFFTVMEKHFHFLLLMNSHHLLPHFVLKVDELLDPAFKELKGTDMPFQEKSIQYALTFSTGGFMRILIQWINDSERKSPDEMALMMKDLISIFNYSN